MGGVSVWGAAASQPATKLRQVPTVGFEAVGTASGHPASEVRRGSMDDVVRGVMVVELLYRTRGVPLLDGHWMALPPAPAARNALPTGPQGTTTPGVGMAMRSEDELVRCN
jgi:hypothetical protein